MADLFGDLVGFFVGTFFNKGMYFGKPFPIKEALKESWTNISSGILLMIATFSSMFLIGGAKMVINWHWDETVFAPVAFGFSVSNLFLTFVTAISVVLFPSIKRMKQEELPDLYVKIRQIISPILFVGIAFYFPICVILRLWLPQYTGSLLYLGILFPVIIFSSKTGLLTNNYLKNYRKEKTMLVINVISMAVGFSLFLISAYVFDNINLVLYSTVFIIMACSIVSEIAVMKIIKRERYIDFFVEAIMTLIFIVSAHIGDWKGALIYIVALVVYLIIYRKSILTGLKMVKEKLKKKDK
jgi:hypothetical protein